MSLGLKNQLALDRITILTPIAAICVCDALNYFFGINASIKWVNDIHVTAEKFVEF